MKTQMNTLKNATGKIDYTLLNDCMFHSVMQRNKKVLKGLICALLHLIPDSVQSVTLLNPIEFGDQIRDKEFILDIKVMLNNTAVINIELQVRTQQFWGDRSLSYLCRLFNNLEKGEDYSDVRSAYHIGILDFTLFPDYPEFYATNKMMNVKRHYIFNDKFTLNVLDLNQLELATKEDQQWKLDYWALLFKTSTWEELKMLAEQDEIFQETCETMFRLNQDDQIRYWCEACEEADRVARTIESNFKKELAIKNAIIAEKDNALAEKDNALAEKDNALAEKDNALAEKDNALAEKDNALAEKDNALAEKDDIIASQKNKYEQLFAEQENTLAEIARLKALLQQK